MRITTYKAVLNEDRHNYLVKDQTYSYEGCLNLSDAKQIVHVMCDVFEIEDAAEEYMYMICMNNKCIPIAFFQVGHGSVNMCPVGIREIMVRNTLCGASGFVLVHNHPSGIPNPSDEDFEMTKKVGQAADIMGITLLDHIVIGTRNCYYSMRQNGILGNGSEQEKK